MRARGDRDRPLPKRPYRDSALVYAGLAGIVVGFAALTGGNMLDALAVAGGFFVVATAWSWWRWRGELARRARRP